jgi:hypothetical protein
MRDIQAGSWREPWLVQETWRKAWPQVSCGAVLKCDHEEMENETRVCGATGVT